MHVVPFYVKTNKQKKAKRSPVPGLKIVILVYLLFSLRGLEKSVTRGPGLMLGFENVFEFWLSSFSVLCPFVLKWYLHICWHLLRICWNPTIHIDFGISRWRVQRSMKPMLLREHTYMYTLITLTKIKLQCCIYTKPLNWTPLMRNAIPIIWWTLKIR